MPEEEKQYASRHGQKKLKEVGVRTSRQGLLAPFAPRGKAKEKKPQVEDLPKFLRKMKAGQYYDEKFRIKR